jgi:two-component system KDP operon response regulator KdpE
MARVLFCEDDFALRLSLTTSLRAAGHDVTACASAEEANAAARQLEPELVVLDWNLPGMDGATLLKRWRAEGKHFPVLMVSARNKTSEKLEALLQAGADDYLTKPFATEELLARIEVQLRRRHAKAQTPPPPLRLGERVVDLSRRTVQSGEETITLTTQEAQLLAYLVVRPSRLIPRTELLREVWGYRNPNVRTRAVDNAIYRLRAKLEVDPAEPKHLLVEHGMGYRFEP